MQMKVVFISGSPSVKSRSTVLLTQVARELAAKGVATEFFSIRDFAPEDLIHANFAADSLLELIAAIEQSSALVIGTPVYKASFSGALKTLLDLLPERALQGKTVLTCVTGGTASHMLAVDYALKPVLSALKASEILDGVFATDQQVHYGQQGLPDYVDDRIAARLDGVTDQLYAALLRHAPAIEPQTLGNCLRQARFSI